MVHAQRAWQSLGNAQIKEMYGFPAIFKSCKWPQTGMVIEYEDEAHITLSGFFECAKIPVICHITDLIRDKVIKDKDYYEFAFDLLTASHQVYVYDYTVDISKSLFYSRLQAEPTKFIQPQPQLRLSIEKLKD